MELYEVIRNRRSVRAYKPDPVDPAALDRILEAVRQAPSAANKQPWRLYVIRDAAKREALRDAYAAEWFSGAPVIICACGLPAQAWQRRDGKSYMDVDVAIAFEHLVLAAEAEGLGTCWVGAFDPRAARRVLQLPATEEPIAMTPLGLPAEVPPARERKPLEEIVTCIG